MEIWRLWWRCSGDGGDGGGPHVVVGPNNHIFTIYMYKYAMQKYFCDTMKYKNINDGIYIFMPP